MAKKAILNIQVTDDAGNVVPSASVEITRELGGATEPVFSDRAGTASLTQPLTTDTDGFVAVHVAGGAFKVRAYTGDTGSPTFEKIWRYVGAGLGGETDIVSLTPQAAWSNATTFSTGDLVTHVDGGDTYIFASLQDSNLNNEPDAATPGDTVYWMLVPGGASGADGVQGVLQAYSTTTSDADPGAGTFRLDNATIASATEGYFDNLEQGGGDVSAWIDAWDDSSSTVKGTLILRSTVVAATFAIFTVSGSITDGTGYRKATLTHVASNGTFSDGVVFAVQFVPTGDKGDTGNTGSTGAAGADGTDPGILQAYSTTTADADPGAGAFRLNNATIASVTQGYFDNLDNAGGDVSACLDTWDDSTNTAHKGSLVLRDTTDASVWAVFTVTGSVTDGTGYRKVTLTHVASNGTFTDTRVFSLQFSRTGNKGADGAGSGDMTAATYDPQTIVGDTFDTDNHTDGTTNKVFSATEQTKLSGIETAADVTDATNVAAAGAAMLGTAQNWSAAQNFADNTLQRANLLDYGEITNAIGSIGGGTQDIDLTLGNVVTGTVDTSTTTFTFSNPTASDEGCSFTLILTNGGSQTVNWPASVDWAGGTPPTLTSAGVDVLTFITVDGGTTWYGFPAGLDMQ